jgi:transposase InsO family protein
LGRDVARPPPAGPFSHNLFGHAGPTVLTASQLKQQITGLDNVTIAAPDHHKCSTCTSTKQKRVSFACSDSLATAPLQLLRSDLMFMSCEGLMGEQYMLTVLDDFTKYSEVTCISKKNAVTDELVTVIHRLQRQTGHAVKAVRTDHGTEYCAFDNFCMTEGIVRQCSAPQAPERNGRAQRLNRTIVEKIRALLHHHNTPKILLSEAIHVSCSLRNCVSEAGQRSTPYEFLYGEKPDVSRLRIFVCCLRPYKGMFQFRV